MAKGEMNQDQQTQVNIAHQEHGITDTMLYTFIFGINF